MIMVPAVRGSWLMRLYLKVFPSHRATNGVPLRHMHLLALIGQVPGTANANSELKVYKIRSCLSIQRC
jgi:hypothetical protein